MDKRTVTHPRADALVGRIARLDGDPARREAVTLGLVDALLEGDGETLTAALDGLRDARARAAGEPSLVGWLDAAIAFAHWGLERLPSPAALAQGTQSHDFLRALEDAPHLGSAELRRLLEIDDTQVSRTGRRLLEAGLVSRGKVGRQVFWRLTPRGERALADAPAPERSPNAEFWQDALGRGFDAALGETPDEARPVDPTRERIIECTLGLHLRKGIRATTWADVAAEAGVPVETVEAMFPSLDELSRSCGEHFMETLGLPPYDRAAEVFARAASGPERIHLLVGTMFGAYERGAPGIDVARREQDVPAARESLEELDHSFDALVAEALGGRRAETASVASLRALTDLEVWRGLRDHGASSDAAVEQTSTTVERWLQARAPH